MAHLIASLDSTVLQRAQRIAAVTVASLALGAPVLVQAQATPATPATPAAPSAGADKASGDSFKRADANQDGKLSKDEAARIPAIAAKFDELDKDKDGSLSMSEMANAK